jgi:Flp pilus assembly protein TadB
MLAVFVVLSVLTAVSALWVRRLPEPHLSAQQANAWQRAVDESSQLGRILLSTSRPMRRLPSVFEAGESRQYRQLTKRLQAAQVFGGSVEVFLSYQALMTLIGVGVLAATIVGADSGAQTFMGVAGAVGLTALPYNELSKRTKARVAAVSRDLPEFAELLRMPLAAGVGVMESLRFTAARQEGVVAEEIRRMIKVRQAGVSEAQAFQEAGIRLGTPEAEAFFITLLNAVTGGSKAVEQITAQAAELRKLEFQRRRAEGKKLPVKMIGVMAAHFMPLLFVVVAIPTVMSLGGA